MSIIETSHMASQTVVQELLIKEKYANLGVLQRRGNSGEAVAQHIKRVKDYVQLFTQFELGTEEDKTNIFLRYFDDEIIKEIKSERTEKDGKPDIEFFAKKISKLLELKESEISTISSIFRDLSQNREESVIDFGKRIRMRCMNWEGDKEKLMVSVFIKGVKSRYVSAALKHVDPKTLEEAIEKVKDVFKPEGTSDDERGLFHVMNTKESDLIKSLREEIANLKKTIEMMTKRKENFNKQPERQFNQEHRRFQRHNFEDTRKCFQCGKVGHISRYCKEQSNMKTRDYKEAIKCFGCGGNHMIKFCNRKNFRYFQEDDNATQLSQEVEERSEDKSLNVISSWNKKKSDEIKERLSKATLEEKYVNFINDQAAKPREILHSYEPTLISKRRSEKARNKPIAECSIGSRKVKVMFDTGADLNVISEELCKELKAQNNAIRIYESNTKIRCANGSEAQCVGKVKLSVAVGPILTTHVFDIMPDIFPHLYIGIRSMKKFGIDVMASEDCIEIQGIKVPFMSKTVVPASLN